jgi:hypothetical protein
MHLYSRQERANTMLCLTYNDNVTSYRGVGKVGLDCCPQLIVGASMGTYLCPVWIRLALHPPALPAMSHFLYHQSCQLGYGSYARQGNRNGNAVLYRRPMELPRGPQL